VLDQNVAYEVFHLMVRKGSSAMAEIRKTLDKTLSICLREKTMQLQAVYNLFSIKVIFSDFLSKRNSTNRRKFTN